jgi:formylglycine-generating enzyme required for sulfatase activity
MEPASWECTKAKGLPGAPMVRVETPNGKSYCMDIREVYQKEYAEFYEAIKSSDLAKNPGVRHPDCKHNQFYPKVGTWEAECDPTGYSYTPEKYPESPVGCVDWCDAKAYCEWAGKRLCGRVGGGTVTQALVGNANEDQWYNVCSMGGKSKYATGDTYQEGQCLDKSFYAIDPDKMNEEEMNSRTRKKLTEAHKEVPDCHGTTEPFDQIHDINGSRAELTDACDVNGASSQCFLRGGHFGSDAVSFECAKWAWYGRTYSSPSTGFRCCLDE